MLKRSTEYLAQYMREKRHVEQISHCEISEQHAHTHTHKMLTVSTMETENITYKASKIRIHGTSP